MEEQTKHFFPFLSLISHIWLIKHSNTMCITRNSFNFPFILAWYKTRWKIGKKIVWAKHKIKLYNSIIKLNNTMLRYSAKQDKRTCLSEFWDLKVDNSLLLQSLLFLSKQEFSFWMPFLCLFHNASENCFAFYPRTDYKIISSTKAQQKERG